MHRLAATFLALSFLLLAAPAAPAQEQGAVRLSLVHQTPWNSIDEPNLEVEVRAENTGDAPLDQLSIGITLWAPVRSRTAYEETLANDPSPAVTVDAEPPRPQEGTLEPGATRTFSFRLDLSFLATTPGLSTQSLVYPLRVDLRSRNAPVAVLRTPVVFLVKKPETPLNLAWTFVLHEPILFGPDGRFETAALEQALAPGGRLAGAIRAIRALVTSPEARPVDLVLSPTLLLQLARMRAGYTVVESGRARRVAAGQGGAAAAADALAALKEIAAAHDVQVSALPFAAPSLPALVAGGLARDLPVQLERGRQVVATLLGATPDTTVFRPPYSALDEESLDELLGQGAPLLLLDPSAVPPMPQPLGFAAPATASLEAGGGSLTAVVPDAGVEALLSSPTTAADPVLGAQTVLGELAVVWLEQPGVERGLAVTFPEEFAPPGGFFAALVRGIAAAPWLRPISATALATAFPPPDQPVRLAAPDTGRFGPTYVEDLKRARRRIDIYRSILANPSTVPDQLSTRLLLAESGQFVDDQEAGLRFIHSVRATLGATFAMVRPDTGQIVTLTSNTGKIPVRVTNETGQPVEVIVELVSPHLRFPQSASQGPLRLTGPDVTLSFDVEVQTTGARFPVQVLVRSPTGRVISQDTLIVRSTAYNRVALVITIGAAIVLLALWARRFLPRRTT